MYCNNLPTENLNDGAFVLKSGCQPTTYRAPLDLMPEALRQLAIGLPVTSSAEEFRNQPNLKTGNPLIDTYAENDPSQPGEMGRGFTFVSKEESDAAATLQNEYIVNVLASDVIPLNRMVPDARMKG